MHIRRHNPETIVSPASSYAQALEVRDATRWLLVSGQVGLDPDARLAGDTRAQMRRCFENIFEVLKSAGMGYTHIVKLTAFITEPTAVSLYREVRDQMLGGHICASTLLVVNGLAHPQWTVEIEAVAAA